MNPFSGKLIRLVQVILVFGAAVSSDAGEQVKWEPLFDGKTLDGWEVHGGFAKYHVEDEIIVGTTVEGSPNTFLCTKKQYGDFILEFEVNIDPRLNSGVQIRSHSFEEYRNGRVHGYQVEIDPSERAWSGGIYDEARRGWLNDLKDNETARKAFKNGQWNKFRVRALGDSIKTWVNGAACADLRDPADQTGFIALQVHSFRGEEPAQVRWRNIRIKKLGRHVWEPLFDGKSLDGWHVIAGGNWDVHDGVIVGSNIRSDKRQGLLVSDKRYGDFTARLKFKVEKGNSGFYFRVDELEGQGTVQGLQAEIDESKNVGGLYETDGRGWVAKPREKDVAGWFKPQQWNKMTVSAYGRRIVVHVNDQKSVELKNDKGRLQGHLALQLHGEQGVHVLFKDIEILVPKK
jgi:hypothetical protein